MSTEKGRQRTERTRALFNRRTFEEPVDRLAPRTPAEREALMLALRSHHYREMAKARWAKERATPPALLLERRLIRLQKEAALLQASLQVAT